MQKLILFALMISIGVPSAIAQPVTYSSHIRSLFVSYGCTGCHGGSGGLFVDTYTNLLTTGLHKPVVIPRDTNSILVRKIKGTAEFGARMPLGGSPMAANDLNTIIQWIANGAPETTTLVGELDDPASIYAFTLKQNYPNPFNPSTTIRFSLQKHGIALLRVFDVGGQEVGTLFHAEVAAGETRQIVFNAGDLTSGIYLVRLDAGRRVASQKMILMR